MRVCFSGQDEEVMEQGAQWGTRGGVIVYSATYSISLGPGLHNNSNTIHATFRRRAFACLCGGFRHSRTLESKGSFITEALSRTTTD